MPTVASPLPDLVLYSRSGCHLCDAARAAINAVLAARRERGLPTPTVIEIDIEADADLHRRLLERIPVVELGPGRIELIVTVGKLRRVFADVLDQAASSPAAGSGAT
jgi:hypothetical protein